jgi:N-acetylmuramoyl-L-alanine amidase
MATVILDAAHGGTDSGAHGDPSEGGAEEKDLVLAIALGMRRELERQGVRVVMTRQTDVTLSLDERAAAANAWPGGFFVTLHVASSGSPKTAVAYSFGWPPGGGMASAAGLPAARPAAGAITWDEAQAGYASQSRRLAEVLQVELAQKLPGSPDAPQLAAVRQLRIVAHPAVAVELASVAMEDPQSLARTALPLANAVVRAIAAYREATAKP